MPISVVFDTPLPSDSPSTFNTKAFTLLGDLNDWSTQANALPGEVATNLTTLLAAPPAIGSTTPAAVSATTLSASSYTAASGYYINASAVLTPGATTQGTQFVTSSILQWACGSGGYSWNNNANSASLMSMTNSGAVTIPGSLTSESVTITGGAYAVGKIYYEAAGGIVVVGKAGSASDLVLCNGTGRNAVEILAGTTPTVKIPGSLSLTGGTFGYGVGAGGTVTQATSKSTAVTLNKPCGQITMNNEALAAGATVVFNVTNSYVIGESNINLQIRYYGTGGGPYSAQVIAINSGSFDIALRNNGASPLSDAVVLNFSVISGASS